MVAGESRYRSAPEIAAIVLTRAHEPKVAATIAEIDRTASQAQRSRANMATAAARRKTATNKYGAAVSDMGVAMRRTHKSRATDQITENTGIDLNRILRTELAA